MLQAREKLRPFLKLSKTGSNWRNDPNLFQSGEEGLQGSVSLSTAWFEQGHEVRASVNRIHFSAAHFELGSDRTTPEVFYELRDARRVGVATCHLRIQLNYKCNPGSHSP